MSISKKRKIAWGVFLALFTVASILAIIFG